MKAERIDHIHVKVNNIKSITSALEGVIGTKFLMEADFTADFAMQVAFNRILLG